MKLTNRRLVGDVHVQILQSVQEKQKAFQLRKQIYCDELNWVKSRCQDMEFDDYDNDAIIIGAKNPCGELLGTVRIIPAVQPMMIEYEFFHLISPSHNIIKGKDAAEISRLAVRRLGNRRQEALVSCELYKYVNRWSLLHNVRYLYMVVEQKMFRNLKLYGYPCKQIGPVHRFSDGIDALAAILDWHQFDRMNEWRTNTPVIGTTQQISYDAPAVDPSCLMSA